MHTNETTTMLDDREVNIKTRLALLWVALMFFYIYNDLFSIWQPGHVADLVDGHIEGIHFDQTILFGGAVLMAFPSFMIVLSLTLKARVNRLVNIIMGFFQVLVLVGTQFVGDSEPSPVDPEAASGMKTLARPKSRIFRAPPESRTILAGLRSR